MPLIDLGKIQSTLELDLNQFLTQTALAQKQIQGLNQSLVAMGTSAKKGATKAVTSLQQLAKSGAAIEQLGVSFQQVGRSLSLFITAPLVALAGGALLASIKFESAFAGIRKTVTATEPEFQKLAAAIITMSKEIPVSANALALFGEIGGQMGVAAKDLPVFIRVIAELGDATNLTGEEGALMLSRFAKVTGTPIADIRTLGDVIVELGNNLAAQEDEILLMSLRISGAGTQAGLSAAEILALGGALTELGFRAEAGGTATSRILKSMFSAVQSGGQDLQIFAAIAGVSMGEFARVFEQDARVALINFLAGLRDFSETGGNANEVFEGLGLSGVRVSDVMLRTSQNMGSLTKAMTLANGQIEKGGALSEEFAKRAATTAKQLELARNRVVAVAIALGDDLKPILIDILNNAITPMIDRLRLLVKWFVSLPGPVKAVALGLAALLASAGPFLFVLGGMAQGVGAVVTAFAKFSGFIAAGGILRVALGGLAAFLGPTGVILLGIAATAAAIWGIITAIKAFSGETKTATADAKKFGDVFKGSDEEAGFGNFIAGQYSTGDTGSLSANRTSAGLTGAEIDAAFNEAFDEQEKPDVVVDTGPKAELPLATANELRERALALEQARLEVTTAAANLEIAKLDTQHDQIALAEQELQNRMAVLAAERQIAEASIARLQADLGSTKSAQAQADLRHRISILALDLERIALEERIATVEGEHAVNLAERKKAMDALATTSARMEQNAATAENLRRTTQEAVIAQLQREGATRQQIEKAKIAYELRELEHARQLLLEKQKILAAEFALTADPAERSRLTTAAQGIVGELAEVQAERALIEEQARNTGTAFGEAFATGFGGMLTSILAGGGFLQSIQSGIASIGQDLMAPIMDSLAASLKSSLTSLFGSLGTTLGPLAQGAIGAALIGISTLFNQQKAEVEALGDEAANNIESIERTRGLIAGEQSIAIQQLTSTLGEAFRPTNEILLRMELLWRMALLGDAAPRTGPNGGISVSGIFGQELLGSSRL